MTTHRVLLANVKADRVRNAHFKVKATTKDAAYAKAKRLGLNPMPTRYW